MVNMAPSGWQIPAALSYDVQEQIAAAEAYRAAQGTTLDLQVQQLGQAYTDTLTDIRARQEVLNTQLSQIDSAYRDEMGLINEQQALLDLQRAQIDPTFRDQQKIFKAQEALLRAQSSEYRLAKRQLEARQQEFAQLTTALDDIANQSEVGRELVRRATYDKRYAAAGIPAPIEVNRPLEGEAPDSLPPGVRYSVETDAQRLGREFARNEQVRGFAAEEAALGSRGAGLDLSGVQIDVNRNDAQRQRDLARARVGVGQAGIDLSRGDLSRSRTLTQAQINAQQTGLQTQLSQAERDLIYNQQRLNEQRAGLNLSLASPGLGLI